MSSDHNDENPPFMPPHKAGCTITHNDHLSNYATVADEEKNNSQWFEGSWVSAESRAYAIEHNELWTLQWYPHTPNGFKVLHAGRWADIVKRLKSDGGCGWD